MRGSLSALQLIRTLRSTPRRHSWAPWYSLPAASRVIVREDPGSVVG